MAVPWKMAGGAVIIDSVDAAMRRVILVNGRGPVTLLPQRTTLTRAVHSTMSTSELRLTCCDKNHALHPNENGD